MDDSRLEDVIQKFTTEVKILKQQSAVADAPVHCNEQWATVEATLQSLEAQVEHIRQRLLEDSAAEPAIQALVVQLRAEQNELEAIEACLPQLSGEAGKDVKSRSSTSPAAEVLRESQATLPISEEPAAKAPAAKRAPGSPVTDAELVALPAHVRGRQTAAKVNAVLESLLSVAKSNQQLLRTPSLKVSAELQPKHKILTSAFNTKEQQRKLVVLDSEIMGGPSVRQTITILRNLGRLSEVREAKGARMWEVL